MSDLSTTQLKEGQKAPDFTGLDQDGNTISLKDYRGKKLVLFFYPRDNTPGCSAEVCNLRDHFDALKEAGYSLLGVSADSARKHKNFIAKFDLPFPLIADTEREIIEAFGVWGRKKFMGREFDGILRTTFVIDEKGLLTKVITKVNTKDHASQVLE